MTVFAVKHVSRDGTGYAVGGGEKTSDSSIGMLPMLMYSYRDARCYSVIRPFLCIIIIRDESGRKGGVWTHYYGCSTASYQRRLLCGVSA